MSYDTILSLVIIICVFCGVFLFVGIAIDKPHCSFTCLAILCIAIPIGVHFNKKYIAERDAHYILHKYDSDAVVIEGQNIDAELHDYLSHGYELQGGCSADNHGRVYQTVIRKNK